jgi:hypothetical protein
MRRTGWGGGGGGGGNPQGGGGGGGVNNTYPPAGGPGSGGLLLVPAACRGFCREGRSGAERGRRRKRVVAGAEEGILCVKALRCDANGFTGRSVLYNDSARVNL